MLGQRFRSIQIVGGIQRLSTSSCGMQCLGTSLAAFVRVNGAHGISPLLCEGVSTVLFSRHTCGVEAAFSRGLVKQQVIFFDHDVSSMGS